jgi:hypothetical protein
MMPQLKSIENFAERELSDVLDPRKDVRLDPRKPAERDPSYVEIATPFNTYKISAQSSFVEPPSGAPIACRSVGTVTFRDPVEGTFLIGPKGNDIYAQISRHIHVREYTDRNAVAKRDLAENQNLMNALQAAQNGFARAAAVQTQPQLR